MTDVYSNYQDFERRVPNCCRWMTDGSVKTDLLAKIDTETKWPIPTKHNTDLSRTLIEHFGSICVWQCDHKP